MTDARPLVSVLGMRGIETELQAERLPTRLLFQKLDAPVAKDLRFVALAAVRLLLEIGIATEFPTDIEHAFGRGSCQVDMFLTEVPSSIPRSFQNGEVGRFAQFRIKRAGRDPIAMFPLIGPSEKASPSHPAGRRRNEGILISHALMGQAIDVRRLHNRMPRDTKGVIALIIGVKQKDVRPRISLCESRDQHHCARQREDGTRPSSGACVYGLCHHAYENEMKGLVLPES